MKKSEQEIFESLILGGLIGAALGALVTQKKESSLLGAVAGAAILASLSANKKALKSKVPMLIEEGNSIYQITSKGEKKFVKKILKLNQTLPANFKLK